MKQRKPKLGQNFLVDDAARHTIVEALGNVRDRTVIEIGPGHGAITEILAARCKRLLAIELDPSLAAKLRVRFRDLPHVEIVERDVLHVDLRMLLSPGESADVVGNLPYYITSDILLLLFSAGAMGVIIRAIVMMQREVADRVAARPGTRAYSLLSATAQMNAQVETLFFLPPEAFSPPPDVHSTVLRLQFAPRFAELGVDAVQFNTFLKQSFAQKRKTFANNLRVAGYSADALRAAWPASIPYQARAESIPLDYMAEIWRRLAVDRPGQTSASLAP